MQVIRIWNTEKGGPKNLEGGRGRGRGKTFKSEDGEQGQQGEGWSSREQSGKGGLWDDSVAAGSGGADGLDLSDFAAMALKFRSEMESMKLNGEGGDLLPQGEDAMTMMADEQNRRAAGGIEDEDDEPLPDWATDEPASAPQPEAKRSLLLDTLNIKRPAEAAASAAGSYGIGGGLDLKLSPVAPAAAPVAVPAPPPLVPRAESTEWQYTDPQGQIQGPFSQDNMRQWHEAGYFNADLPIRLRHWQRFHPFQTVFPDFKGAFLNIPQEPGSGSLVLSMQQQQQAALRQQQEEQRREQERLAAEAQRREQEQRAQQEALRQAEAVRLAEQARLEQLRQAQLAAQQQQAQQILLEQQRAEEAQRHQQERHQQEQAQRQAQQAPASPAKAATAAPWANKQPGPSRTQDLSAIQQEEAAAREVERKRAAAEQAKVTKGWSAPSNAGGAQSLAEIQAQEEEQRQRQQSEAARNAPAAAPATSSMSLQLKSLLGVKSAPAPAPTSGGPAWNASSAPAQGKPAASLRDIMHEENSGRAEESGPATATTAGAPAARKPSSWAAKAGGTTFSAPEAPAARPAAARTGPTAAAPAAPSPTPARPTASVPSAPTPTPTPKVGANAGKEKSSFGGKEMSPDMATWCTAQLKRLNGSDDLTLMQFCMSLDSAAEIRQYLSEYLGSSPAVTNFATEFIKYKEGGRKALDAAGVTSGSSGAPVSSGNNNNPSNFVSAGKKKSGNKAK
jgi:hypothetical protein